MSNQISWSNVGQDLLKFAIGTGIAVGSTKLMLELGKGEVPGGTIAPGSWKAKLGGWFLPWGVSMGVGTAFDGAAEVPGSLGKKNALSDFFEGVDHRIGTDVKVLTSGGLNFTSASINVPHLAFDAALFFGGMYLGNKANKGLMDLGGLEAKGPIPPKFFWPRAVGFPIGMTVLGSISNGGLSGVPFDFGLVPAARKGALVASTDPLEGGAARVVEDFNSFQPA